MPSRDWRPYRASARAGLIALALLVVGTGNAVGGGNAQGEHGAPAPNAPAAHGAASNNPAPYQPRCERPQSREDAEYCEERRSAEAVQEQAKWGFWQFIITVVGTGAIVITLYFAKRAADAAWKAAGVAESALTDLERPYVYMDVLQTGMGVADSKFVTEPDGKQVATGRELKLGRMEVVFFNFGRSPANLKRLEIDVLAAPHGSIPDPIDPTRVGGRPLPIGVVADQTRPYKETMNLFPVFNFEDRDAIVDRNKSAWIMGFARYDDIFKKHHIIGFTLTVDIDSGPPSVAFFRGDERYNYARTEEEGDIPPPSSG